MISTDQELICICVLNYCQPRKTIRCLESILIQTDVRFHIALIDNASPDDSVQQFVDHFGGNLQLQPTAGYIVSGPKSSPGSRITLIRAPRNGGYSFGNNLGIRFAQRYSGFTRILILNNDTLLPDAFLSDFLSCVQEYEVKHPGRKSAWGAMETRIDGTRKRSGFHHLNLPTGLVFRFPVWPSLRYLAGSCILLPAIAPLMDERYFLYYDDCAYGKILKSNGFNLSICKTVSYKHEIGGSTNELVTIHQIIFTSMKLFYQQYYNHYFPGLIACRILLAVITFRFRLAIDLIQAAKS